MAMASPVLMASLVRVDNGIIIFLLLHTGAGILIPKYKHQILK
jgi:hypothetical protein